MERILITGAKGQLGSSIREKLKLNKECIFLSREELDLTNINNIYAVLSNYNPDIIINCAAYTAVDKAEDDRETAEMVNALAPAVIASYCSENNCRLIHISTDYVFNGYKTSPYYETDLPDPLNVYGLTKLKGEQLVTGNCEDAVIIRTSWVYSAYGNNFVKTMLRLMESKDSLNVVNDQHGTPCYAGDLAEAILHIAGLDYWLPGIYHYSNAGATTWFEFAERIKQFAEKNVELKPITSEFYPVKAKRPKYSVLSKEKIHAVYNLKIPDWEVSLKAFLSTVDLSENGAKTS